MHSGVKTLMLKTKEYYYGLAQSKGQNKGILLRPVWLKGFLRRTLQTSFAPQEYKTHQWGEGRVQAGIKTYRIFRFYSEYRIFRLYIFSDMLCACQKRRHVTHTILNLHEKMMESTLGAREPVFSDWRILPRSQKTLILEASTMVQYHSNICGTNHCSPLNVKF